MTENKKIVEILKYFISEDFFFSLIVVAITIGIMYFIKQYLIKKVAYTSKSTQHRNTLIGVLFNVLQYLVVLAAIIIIMKLHNVEIKSILTGLGVMATIVGLSLQDTLKDMFSGINIYNNNFYKVGDMVRYNNEECDVKYFNARVTKFQSVKTGSTYTVCNSMIKSIEKIKDKRILTFYFPLDEEKEKIDRCFEKVVERMKEESKRVRDIHYESINEISEKGVGYEISYTAAAHKAEEVRDDLFRISYEELHKAKLRPFRL